MLLIQHLTWRTNLHNIYYVRLRDNVMFKNVYRIMILQNNAITFRAQDFAVMFRRADKSVEL